MLRILMMCCFPALLFGGQPTLDARIYTAEQVLDKLYQANGNQVFLKPRIEWSTEAKRVASFRRRSNTIVLEEQAYAVCRSFGRDSLSALAFILGHELSHAYQEEGWQLAETNFLAHGYTLNSNNALEKNADVGGVFMAYLAGYSTTPLVPELLKSLYDAYDLIGRDLPGYPPLDERMATGREVQEMTRELIEIFETGNLLSVAGQYDLADACFSYVEQFYKGREVYNNMAINKALYAINFTSQTAEEYAYPLEMAWDTRLQKPRAARGEEGLTEAERAERRMLLNESLDLLEKVRKMNSRDFAPKLNIFCITMLLDGPSAAIDFYNQKKLYKDSRLTASQSQADRLDLAVGIAYARMGNTAEANIRWTELSTDSRDPGVRQMAQVNLATLFGQRAMFRSSSADLPFSTTRGVDGVRNLQRAPVGEKLRLTTRPVIEVSMVQEAQSRIVTFFKDQRFVFVLQRIPEQKALEALPMSDQMVSSRAGTLVYCPNEKVIVRTKGNRMEEWVKVKGF